MKIFTEQRVRVELIEEYCVKNNLSKKEFVTNAALLCKLCKKSITKIAETLGIDVSDLYVNE